MNPFQRILVGVDISDTDYRLLEALKWIGSVYNPEQAYALHVSPGLEIPDFAKAIYEDNKLVPIDEQIEEEIKRKIDHVFPAPSFSIKIDIQEGKLTDKLLHWAKVKNADLTIVGKKKPEIGRGLSTHRFIRKSSSSVLFVPPEPIKPVRKILVPTDYSPDAKYALEAAIEMAKKLPELPEIIQLFVYDVPSEVHFDLMRSRVDFESMMFEGAKEYYENFIKKIDTKGVSVKSELIQSQRFNPAWHIQQYAEDNEVDFIMMGAKGHSAIASFLLGSVTERLLSMNKHIPMLVLRKPVEKKALKRTNMIEKENLTEAI